MSDLSTPPLQLAPPTRRAGGTAVRPSTLAPVRNMERVAGLCRTLHGRLDAGRWTRTRRRLRKQLRRLDAVLDDAQRAVLRGAPLVLQASGPALALAPALEQALRPEVTKAELKGLRRQCRDARRRLELALDPM